MTVHARAAFEYMIDDLADVAVRNATRSPTARSQMRTATIVVGLLCGAAVAALGKLRQPDATWSALAMGALASVAGALVFLVLYPKHQRGTTHRQLAELLGPGPFTCTVELHDDHMVWFDEGKNRLVETRIPWSDLREIREEGGDWVVESRTGISILRRKAFATDSEADTFLATIERLSRAASSRVTEPGAPA